MLGLRPFIPLLTLGCREQRGKATLGGYREPGGGERDRGCLPLLKASLSKEKKYISNELALGPRELSIPPAAEGGSPVGFALVPRVLGGGSSCEVWLPHCPGPLLSSGPASVLQDLGFPFCGCTQGGRKLGGWAGGGRELREDKALSTK